MPNSLRSKLQLFVLLGLTLVVASGCIWWGPRGGGFRDGDRGWHDGGDRGGHDGDRGGRDGDRH
jgi:hypothetical protein